MMRVIMRFRIWRLNRRIDRLIEQGVELNKRLIVNRIEFDRAIDCRNGLADKYRLKAHCEE